MSLRTSRDIVGRFFTMIKCKYWPVLSSETKFAISEFCIAHAQRKFVKVVLYLKIISSPTLTSVESFMLVSGIAQSWLLAA